MTAFPWDEPSPERTEPDADFPRVSVPVDDEEARLLRRDLEDTPAQAVAKAHDAAIRAGKIDRNPYVGEGADGALRSAKIDREEIDGLDRNDPRIPYLEESILQWEAQAARISAAEGATATVEVDEPTDEQTGPEPDPGTEIARSFATLDLRTVDELLERLADPDELRHAAGSVKDTVVDAVRRRHDARRTLRIEKLEGEPPTSSTDVRRELIGAANDADALDALASAFAAGATEAKGIGGDLLDELPGRGGKPRASIKAADGHGFEVTLSRSKPTKLSVNLDELIDVLVAHGVAAAQEATAADRENGPLALKTHPAKVYAAAYRQALDDFRRLLSASPAFKSTALDELVTILENGNDDDLAKRARKTYGRKETGSPSVKIDRKPIESKDEEGSK